MPETEETDKIRAVIAGDVRAFEWIVTQYKDNVARICMNMLKDRNLADEIGQDTFIRLYAALPTFRFEASLKTFISKIAVNLSLNKLKQQKTWWNRFVSDDDSVKQLTNQSSGNDDRMADREVLQMGLQRLNEQHRAMVVLRMIEGYTIKETAEMLDMKEGTVMSGLSRALDKLKEHLKDLGYEHK